MVAIGTTAESVEVDGAPGVWIAGAEHVLFAPPRSPRLAGNVLVWVRGAVTYRLEGRGLTLERAEAVAAGVRDR